MKLLTSKLSPFFVFYFLLVFSNHSWCRILIKHILVPNINIYRVYSNVKKVPINVYISTDNLSIYIFIFIVYTTSTYFLLSCFLRFYFIFLFCVHFPSYLIRYSNIYFAYIKCFYSDWSVIWVLKLMNYVFKRGCALMVKTRRCVFQYQIFFVSKIKFNFI